MGPICLEPGVGVGRCGSYGAVQQGSSAISSSISGNDSMEAGQTLDNVS